MRDILLSGAIVALLLAALKFPAIGAYTWAWLSIMNPHKLAYGFASSMPFAQLSAGVTLLGLLFARKRQPVPMNAVVILLMAMLAWMTLTSFFAINNFDNVLDRWIFVMKIQLMLFVTWMLIVEVGQLRILVWVVTLSVAYYGIKGGIYTVLTGGSGRVWGPPSSMINGNNELAVALVMVTPFLHWLRVTTSHQVLRLGLGGAMLTCALAVLGTQSRGALLALLAMAGFLALKSRRQIAALISIGAVVSGGILFMPDSWTNRMETIREYQADESAMSRLYTWRTLANAAADRPLVGAGFRADNIEVFRRYGPRDPEYDVFRGTVLVAHSIYFQMLGEHGAVGLALYLALGLATWFTAKRLAAQGREDPELEPWLPLLMKMVQVSLIGFAVGGAFLSLAYLDVIYYIIGYTVLAEGIVRRRKQVRGKGSPIFTRGQQPGSGLAFGRQAGEAKQ